MNKHKRQIVSVTVITIAILVALLLYYLVLSNTSDLTINGVVRTNVLLDDVSTTSVLVTNNEEDSPYLFAYDSVKERVYDDKTSITVTGYLFEGLNHEDLIYAQKDGNLSLTFTLIDDEFSRIGGSLILEEAFLFNLGELDILDESIENILLYSDSNYVHELTISIDEIDLSNAVPEGVIYD